MEPSRGRISKDIPNPARMQASLNGFYGAEVAGLERPEFTNVEQPLRAYMNAVYFKHNKNSQAMYESQIEKLVQP